MPLRWRSRRRFDGIAAGEGAPAGQELPFAGGRFLGGCQALL